MTEKKKTYAVVSRLRVDDKFYPPGSTISLTADDAEPLIKSGTLTDLLADPLAGPVGDPDKVETAVQETTTTSRPEDADAVIDAIMAKLPALPLGDIGADGKPLVAKVEGLVGFDLTEDEVDYAWQRYGEERLADAKKNDTGSTPGNGGSEGDGQGNPETKSDASAVTDTPPKKPAQKKPPKKPAPKKPAKKAANKNTTPESAGVEGGKAVS